MQDKKFQYRGYLIVGLVITFLLVGNITFTNAQEEYTVTHSSIQDEAVTDQSIPSKVSRHDVPDISEDHSLKDSNGIEEPRNEPKFIKTLAPLQTHLRLAGTVLVGKEYTYALIAEETTGRQNLYSVGESIKGAEILKIDKDSVVIEKEGKIWVLKVTGVTNSENSLSETHTENGPLFTGVSEELPFFEPVFSETGPPVDENIHVEELPPFEPITNSTGPPVDPEGLYEGLQEFIPFENDSGPPGV